MPLRVYIAGAHRLTRIEARRCRDGAVHGPPPFASTPGTISAASGGVALVDSVAGLPLSTSEIRYLVLPERPAGTEGMSEELLASLVTRDAMIGVAKATLSPRGERS